MSNVPEVVAIDRVFKASPERVFDAFASYEGMKQWFGPGHCEVIRGEVDFKVGGRYRLRITTDEGEVEVVGEYQTIDRPSRLTFSWRWQDNPEFPPSDSVVEIDFDPHSDGTLLKLRQVGIEDEYGRECHGHGWTGAFDKMDAIFS